jgi:putative drug exporter of the RND superfamily
LAVTQRLAQAADLIAGIGNAASLLLEATIIRSVILPATMNLLGEWNRCLPRRLEWLPDFHVEGAK